MPRPPPPALHPDATHADQRRRARAAALALEAGPHDTADALAAYGASQRVRSRIAEMEHYLAWAGIALPQPAAR